MDQEPIASVQNDSMTPFAWEIHLLDEGTRLTLSAWDLAYPESSRIAAEGEIAVQRDEVLDANDDAPEELVGSIIDSPIAKLPSYALEDDRRAQFGKSHRRGATPRMQG